VTGTRPLSQKEIALFFFPLLLNVQLMSVSHSIINAALARQQDFVTSLAAFSVAMVLHLFLASPSYQNHTVTIAMVRGRRSLRGTVLFVLLVAAYVSAMLSVVAFTPVGHFVLCDLLGMNEAIAAGARSVLGILVFLPLFTGFRGLFQGLVIRARRTGLVSLATGVRIGALCLFLALGGRWFHGPATGAFALLSCIIVETVLMGFFAFRCHLPPTGEEEKGTMEILRFAFPLAYSSCLQQTIPLLINAVISRLPDGPAALASFGVIRGFLFLLAGPMRNLQQTYLTLVRDRADYPPLVIFLRRTGAGMALLILLVAFPLNGPVLGGIMGLDPEMRSYIALPLAFCAFYPLLYGLSNLLRGIFTGFHLTGQLGRSVLFKILVLVFLRALIGFFPFPIPGIAVAILLLLAAETGEMVYLFRQRRRSTSATDDFVPILGKSP
jgi:hypothetical protein